MWCSWSGRSWICCFTCLCTLSVTTHSWHTGISSQMVFFFPVFLPTHAHTLVFYLFLSEKVPSGQVSLEEKRCRALFWSLFGDTAPAHPAVTSGTSAVGWIHHIPQHRGRVGLCLQHPWQKKPSLGTASFWLQQSERSSSAHQNVQQSRLEDGVMTTHTLQTLQCLGGGRFSRRFTVPHFWKSIHLIFLMLLAWPLLVPRYAV